MDSNAHVMMMTINHGPLLPHPHTHTRAPERQSNGQKLLEWPLAKGECTPSLHPPEQRNLISQSRKRGKICQQPTLVKIINFNCFPVQRTLGRLEYWHYWILVRWLVGWWDMFSLLLACLQPSPPQKLLQCSPFCICKKMNSKIMIISSFNSFKKNRENKQRTKHATNLFYERTKKANTYLVTIQSTQDAHSLTKNPEFTPSSIEFIRSPRKLAKWSSCVF